MYSYSVLRFSGDLSVFLCCMAVAICRRIVLGPVLMCLVRSRVSGICVEPMPFGVFRICFVVMVNRTGFSVMQKCLHLLSNNNVKPVDAKESVKYKKVSKTKLASVYLCCKSHGFKIANVKTLSTNSMHRR